MFVHKFSTAAKATLGALVFSTMATGAMADDLYDAAYYMCVKMGIGDEKTCECAAELYAQNPAHSEKASIIFAGYLDTFSGNYADAANATGQDLGLNQNQTSMLSGQILGRLDSNVRQCKG